MIFTTGLKHNSPVDPVRDNNLIVLFRLLPLTSVIEMDKIVAGEFRLVVVGSITLDYIPGPVTTEKLDWIVECNVTVEIEFHSKSL